MKTLKNICTFYLGSWWLPSLLGLVWTITGMIYVFSKMENPAPIEELAHAVGNVLWGTLIFLVGWLASWIWLLFHKKWMKALFSFICACLVWLPNMIV